VYLGDLSFEHGGLGAGIDVGEVRVPGGTVSDVPYGGRLVGDA
jgi:hypothetical protein